MANLSGNRSLYDPPPTEETTPSDQTDEWARSPERKGWVTWDKHQGQISSLVNSVQTGQISEEGALNLSRRVKGLAPFILPAIGQRKSAVEGNKLIGKYVNEGSPASAEQMGPPTEEGQYGARETPAVPAQRNFQGLSDAYVQRGQWDLAKQAREAGGIDKTTTNRGEYFVPIQTAKGIYSFNSRSGQVKDSGGNVVGSASDPDLQAKIVWAKKNAEVKAEDKAKAEIELPGAEADALTSVRLVDDLIKHPGLSASVGPAGWAPKIHGTKQADFITRLEQLQGRQFLDARQLLKGGGQITDFEGKKAEQGIARMQRAQSAEEFKKGATEYQDAVRSGVSKLRGRASGGGAAKSQPGEKPPSDRKSREDAALKALRGGR